MVRKGKKELKEGILYGSRWDSGMQLIFKKKAQVFSLILKDSEPPFSGEGSKLTYPNQTNTSPVVLGKVSNISYISVFHHCSRLPSSNAVVQSHLRYQIFHIHQLGKFQHLTPWIPLWVHSEVRVLVFKNPFLAIPLEKCILFIL